MTAETTERPPPDTGHEPTPVDAGLRRVERLAKGGRAILSWILVIALLLGALELAVRVQDWIRYRTPILSPYRSEQDLIIRDRHGLHRLPGARYKKFVMNNLGMRGPDVALTPSPGTIRIVVAGASEAFGLYESPGKEFPRQIEDSLRVGATRAGCPTTGDFEVLNSALFGMSLPTVAEDLRVSIRRLAPDIVLYYPTPAQYLAQRVPEAAALSSPEFEAPDPPWQRALHLRSVGELINRGTIVLPDRIEDWIRMRPVERRRAWRQAHWLFTEPPEERVSAFEADLRALVGVIRSIGAVPMLVPHANAFAMSTPPEDPYLLNKWVRFYPRATGETIIAFDSIAGNVARRVAADSATLFIDTTPVLRRVPPPAFADYAHFTDAGAAAHAGAIAREILDAVCGGASPLER